MTTAVQVEEARPAEVGMLKRVVRFADLAGAFLFALQGAVVAAQAHCDPVGMVALAFITALGGGLLRDALLGVQAAAIKDWRYAALVLAATVVAWVLYPDDDHLPHLALMLIDAAGLGFFVVAGTDKALEHGVSPLPACFLGTLGCVGGGAVRDLLLGREPQVLFTDIYASAAFAGAVILVLGRRHFDRTIAVALVGGTVCFAIRVAAFTYGWNLPHLVPG